MKQYRFGIDGWHNDPVVLEHAVYISTQGFLNTTPV